MALELLCLKYHEVHNYTYLFFFFGGGGEGGYMRLNNYYKLFYNAH